MREGSAYNYNYNYNNIFAFCYCNSPARINYCTVLIVIHCGDTANSNSNSNAAWKEVSIAGGLTRDDDVDNHKVVLLGISMRNKRTRKMEGGSKHKLPVAVDRRESKNATRSISVRVIFVPVLCLMKMDQFEGQLQYHMREVGLSMIRIGEK